MEVKYYTGIGSRSVPELTKQTLFWKAFDLANVPYILRSGGADGCDLAFEQGSNHANGKKEIYLPWKNFNNSTSDLFESLPEAFYFASQIHPNWANLTIPAKKLHARNIHQVLGKDLQTPSSILYCWTPEGKEVGGTRTALILAKQYDIEIVNYGRPFQKRRYSSLY